MASGLAASRASGTSVASALAAFGAGAGRELEEARLQRAHDRLEVEISELSDTYSRLEEKKDRAAENLEECENRIESSERELEAAVKRVTQVHDVVSRVCDKCYAFPCLLVRFDLDAEGDGDCAICGDTINEIEHAYPPFSVDDEFSEDEDLDLEDETVDAKTRQEAFDSAIRLQQIKRTVLDNCLTEKDEAQGELDEREAELKKTDERLCELESKLERAKKAIASHKLKRAADEFAKAKQHLASLGGLNSDQSSAATSPTSAHACSICFVNSKDTALGCGHTFCGKCLDKGRDTIKNCPTCRMPIAKRMRVYL